MTKNISAISWKSIPGNTAVFNDLLELLKSGKAIAFVGAGASAGIYPLWTELLHTLIDEAESRGAAQAELSEWRASSDQEPQLVVNALQRHLSTRLFQIIREKYGPHKKGKPYTAIHEALLKLPFKGYVTTNYDDGLSQAHAAIRPIGTQAIHPSSWIDEDTVSRWRDGSIFTDGVQPILHAHGIYNKRESIVLDISDYRRAYKPGQKWQATMGRLWMDRRLVIVGSSLTDRYIDHVIEHQSLQAGEHEFLETRHIAILGIDEQDIEKANPRRAIYQKKYSSEILFYPKSGNSHAALLDLLNSLTQLMKTSREGESQKAGTATPNEPSKAVRPKNRHTLHGTSSNKNNAASENKKTSIVTITEGVLEIYDRIFRFQPFAAHARTVSTREYMEFATEGGYLHDQHWEKTETSLAERKRNLESLLTRNPNPDDQPIIGVSFWEATAYCHWRRVQLPNIEQLQVICALSSLHRGNGSNSKGVKLGFKDQPTEKENTTPGLSFPWGIPHWSTTKPDQNKKSRFLLGLQGNSLSDSLTDCQIAASPKTRKQNTFRWIKIRH